MWKLYAGSLAINNWWLIEKSKIGNGGEYWGETVESPEEIVEKLGKTCGNITGNGRKWLGN